MKKVFKWIFYGNIFYGICAIALSIEGSLQQGLLLNGLPFYILVFCCSVMYYMFAYLSEIPFQKEYNSRLIWYRDNRNPIRILLMLLIIISLFTCFIIIKEYWQTLFHLSLLSWLMMFVFPLVGMFYYGVNNTYFSKFILRNIGWLKPFLIGFCWASIAVIYPAIFHAIQVGNDYHVSQITIWLFIKNFMFISLLSILFDIKDYATDSNLLLKTFVVKNGLRKTIFFIIIPLALVGLGSFVTYGITHHFRTEKVLLNSLPFIALLLVAWSMKRRKSIFYYLIVIDGLMLLKALCGIVAMIYF